MDPLFHLPLFDWKISSPCGEAWDEMSGDERRRFCQACSNDVHDLSGLTRAQAEAFAEEHRGQTLCVRLKQGPDGVKFADECRFERRQRRLAWVWRSTWTLAAATTLAAGISLWPRLSVTSVPPPSADELPIYHPSPRRVADRPPTPPSQPTAPSTPSAPVAHSTPTPPKSHPKKHGKHDDSGNNLMGLMKFF